MRLRVAWLGTDRNAADRHRGGRRTAGTPSCVRRLSGSVESRSGFLQEIDFSFRLEHKRAGSVAPLGAIASVRTTRARTLTTDSTATELKSPADPRPTSDASDSRMLSSSGAESRGDYRRVGRHRARDGRAAGARRRGARHLRPARGTARGGRRRNPRAGGEALRGDGRRHARSRHGRARRARGRSVRAARRDDVQRRLRHLRRHRPDRPAQMQQLLDVNYMGTYLAARAALPVFRRQQQRPSDRRLVDRRQARRSVHGRRMPPRSSPRSAWRSRCAPSFAARASM